MDFFGAEAGYLSTPHGFWLLWSKPWLYMYIISNVVIAGAYMVVPFQIWYNLYKAKQLHWSIYPVAFFMFVCSFGHTIDILTIWEPWIQLQHWVDLTTGLFSAFIAMLLTIAAVIIAHRATPHPRNEQ